MEDVPIKKILDFSAGMVHNEDYPTRLGKRMCCKTHIMRVNYRKKTTAGNKTGQNAILRRKHDHDGRADDMDLLSSNSSLMMEKALGYLWTKQAAIADNVTNAETPGYREKVVTFEDSLRSKLLRASRQAAPVKSMRQVLETTPFSVTEQKVQTRMDDNGVNVTAQMSEAIRNAYQMRYVMSSINGGLNTLRTAIRGQ